MFSLKGARTCEIYRNWLKSMLKPDVPLKCLMSNDSDHKILNLLNEKKNAKTDKRKLQMKTAKKVFDYLKGDVHVEKSEPVQKYTDLSGKMNELIKKAETLPETSPESVEIPVAKKQTRKTLKDKDEKQEFLDKAKQVAVALGVDVEVTQTELLEAFNSVKGSFKIQPEKKPVKRDVPHEQRKFEFFRGTAGLNIFNEKVKSKEIRPTLETWNHLKEVNLMYWCLRPPRNYFEEQIVWTQQGKLWHFPLDNDQSWDEELATDFTDHVFLDKHLEPWCPKSGPIRHFMELVTTGLSKNPYLSAEKKRVHILWYRDYFQSKSKLLAELGLLDQNVHEGVQKLEAGENKS